MFDLYKKQYNEAKQIGGGSNILQQMADAECVVVPKKGGARKTRRKVKGKAKSARS